MNKGVFKKIWDTFKSVLYSNEDETVIEVQEIKRASQIGKKKLRLDSSIDAMTQTVSNEHSKSTPQSSEVSQQKVTRDQQHISFSSQEERCINPQTRPEPKESTSVFAGERTLWSSPSSNYRNYRRPTIGLKNQPNFNVTTFVGPSKSEISHLSPFYEGKTRYGGASAATRKIPSVTPYKINKTREHKPEEGMSSAARRILKTLEEMATPISDAKKMPIYDKSPVDLSLFTKAPKSRRNTQFTPSIRPPIADLVHLSRNKILKRKRVPSIPPIESPSTSIWREIISQKSDEEMRIDNAPLPSSNEQPSTPNEQPSTPNELPSASNEQPSTSDEQPTRPNEQPTRPIEQPTRPNEQHTTPNWGENMSDQTSVKTKSAKEIDKNTLQVLTSSPDDQLQPRTFITTSSWKESFLEKTSAGKMKNKMHRYHQSAKESDNNVLEPLSLPSVPLPITTLPEIDFSKKSEQKLENKKPNLFKGFTFSKPIEYDFSNINGIPASMHTQEKNTNIVVELESELTKESPPDQVKLPEVPKQGSFDKKISENHEVVTVNHKSHAQKSVTFQTAVNDVSNSGSSATWLCDACWVTNKESSLCCIACTTPKPQKLDSTDKAVSNVKWKCKICWVENSQTLSYCFACDSPKPQKEVSKDKRSNNIIATWSCAACWVKNKESSLCCVACTTPKPQKLDSIDKGSQQTDNQAATVLPTVEKKDDAAPQSRSTTPKPQSVAPIGKFTFKAAETQSAMSPAPFVFGKSDVQPNKLESHSVTTNAIQTTVKENDATVLTTQSTPSIAVATTQSVAPTGGFEFKPAETQSAFGSGFMQEKKSSTQSISMSVSSTPPIIFDKPESTNVTAPFGSQQNKSDGQQNKSNGQQNKPESFSATTPPNIETTVKDAAATQSSGLSVSSTANTGGFFFSKSESSNVTTSSPFVFRAGALETPQTAPNIAATQSAALTGGFEFKAPGSQSATTPFSFGSVFAAPQSVGMSVSSTQPILFAKPETTSVTTASAPFTFGSAPVATPTSSSAFSAFPSSQPATQPFQFGSQPASTSISPFGASTNFIFAKSEQSQIPSSITQAVVPSFGTSTPNFSFGPKTSQLPNATSQAPSIVSFGPSSSTFSFGNSKESAAIQNATPTFGSSQVSSPFGTFPAFGESKPQAAASGFTFGTASVPVFQFGASNEKKPAANAGFNFGTPSAPETFGSGFAIKTPPSFNFGATSTPAANAAPFKFAASSSEGSSNQAAGLRKFKRGLRRVQKDFKN